MSIPFERLSERNLAGNDAFEADLATLHWHELHYELVGTGEGFVVFHAITDRDDGVEFPLSAFSV